MVAIMIFVGILNYNLKDFMWQHVRTSAAAAVCVAQNSPNELCRKTVGCHPVVCAAADTRDSTASSSYL